MLRLKNACNQGYQENLANATVGHKLLHFVCLNLGHLIKKNVKRGFKIKKNLADSLCQNELNIFIMIPNWLILPKKYHNSLTQPWLKFTFLV